MLSERRYGAFERRRALPPDIDADKINAEFSKGVLEIRLRKDERDVGGARRIDVKKAGSPDRLPWACPWAISALGDPK